MALSLFYGKIIRFLASKAFFYIVIAIFILQALWIAISFQYPMMFDERFHFEVIKIFADIKSPIIYNQPHIYDIYGSLTYGSASIYHYLMSFPYMFLKIFIHDEAAIIILLRVVNILFAASGIFIARRILQEIRIKDAVANIALAGYAMIPLVSLITATISYDNFLFPLFLLFIYLVIKVSKKNTVKIEDLAAVVLLGGFTGLVKFSFLPVFAVGVLIVLWLLLKKPRKKIIIPKKIRMSSILLGLFALIVIPWFFLRYVVSVVSYGSPVPACETVLTEKRCMSSQVYTNEKEAALSSQERSTEIIPQYALSWSKTILLQLDTTGSSDDKGVVEVGDSVPLFSAFMGVSAIVGVAVLLLGWTAVINSRQRVIAIILAGSLILSAFGLNVLYYYKLGQDVNVQTRYLLVVIPLILALSITALNHFIKSKKIKTALLVMTLIVCTQGGGVLKHIITSKPEWYWRNDTLISVNNAARKFLKKVTYEGDILRMIR